MYKLRTIDVWDTLLRREGHPELSKLATSRTMMLTLGSRIQASFSTHWDIYRERCAIEAELARSSEGGEYEIREVLGQLLVRLLLSMDGVNVAGLTEEFAQVELRFEMRHTCPDPGIVEFCRAYPAAETLFLSDFYMPSDDLVMLLRHHGLTDFVGAGISSCDVDLSKRTGALFKHVHDRYGVLPAEHVHIGDNEHSDVKMPSTLGVRVVHYQPVDLHQSRLIRESLLHDRSSLLKNISAEILAEAKGTIGTREGQAKAAYLLGLRVAPLFVGFMLDVAEKALKDCAERLFFFTREGEFFIQVWRIMFPNGKLAAVSLPPVDLLEVSRLATFGASLREVSITELMRLWSLYSRQTALALVKTLGLDPKEFAGLLDAHGILPTEEIVEPWKDGRIQSLFDDPSFVSSVKSTLDEDRRFLRTYLHEHGWGAQLDNVGVVDIGWRGTIQDNLSCLFPGVRINGYYLGLQRFLNTQPEFCAKSAFGPNANVDEGDRDLLDAVSVMEMLCNSPSGSVVGYVQSAQGQMRAVRDVDEKENEAFHQFVAHFQAGVLFASEWWGRHIDGDVITSAELSGPGRAIWRSLIGSVNADLSAAYAKLNHNEIFGLGKFVDKQVVPPLHQILLAPFSKTSRNGVVSFLRQVQWVSGVLGRKDLGVFHKFTLASAMRLALLYKRCKRRIKH